jgi:hypothetical protein
MKEFNEGLIELSREVVFNGNFGFLNSKLERVFENKQVSKYLSKNGFDSKKAIYAIKNYQSEQAGIEFFGKADYYELHLIDFLTDSILEIIYSYVHRHSSNPKKSLNKLLRYSKKLEEIYTSYLDLRMAKDFEISEELVTSIRKVKSKVTESIKVSDQFEDGFKDQFLEKRETDIRKIKYLAVDYLDKAFSIGEKTSPDDLVAEVFMTVFDDDTITAEQIRQNRAEKKKRKV